MTRVLVNDVHLHSIGNALRNRLNVSRTFKPSEMGAAVASIPAPGSVVPAMGMGDYTVIRVQVHDGGIIGTLTPPETTIIRMGKEIE